MLLYIEGLQSCPQQSRKRLLLSHIDPKKKTRYRPGWYQEFTSLDDCLRNLLACARTKDKNFASVTLCSEYKSGFDLVARLLVVFEHAPGSDPVLEGVFC